MTLTTVKRYLSVVLAAGYVVVLALDRPVCAFAPVPVVAPLSARSAVLLDPRSNRVLYAKKPHLERPAASTTKLMTALVVLDRLKLDEDVRVPKSAERIPASKVHLRMGERYAVKDLLKALLISSANDAAHTLAVAAAGSETRFAVLMNIKAHRIGARDTHFTNASGLPNPARQYTTAYDLALIMKEARKNPFVVSVLALRTAVIKANTGRKIHLKNHNKMLWRMPHKIEGKTGFTRRALHCFVGKISAPHRGDVVVAIMGSLRPWRDLMILLGMTHQLDALQMQFNRINLSTEQIADIQRALWRAGFRGVRVDGIFGPKTLKALKDFQKGRGVEADGIIGSKTWAKLKPYLKN